MADNIQLPGTGQVIATKEDGDGKQFQEVMLVDESFNPVSNKDIMVALKALILAVANPSYVDKSANQLRAQVTGAVTVSGTVTSSTTIAISDITLNGGYQPRLEILSNNLGAWANVVRNKIT